MAIKIKRISGNGNGNGNGGERVCVASHRRPGRPRRDQLLHSQNLPLLLPAPNNIFSQSIVMKTVEKESSESPEFFKIILGSIKERLRIPPKFIHHMRRDLTQTAILKIASGNQWTVDINHTRDGVYMEDGWQQFLRENSLGDKHFLIFTYDGDMSFSVKIFEVNGVERLYPASHSTTMPPQKAAAGSNATVKGARGRPKKNPVHPPSLPLLPAPENSSQV